MVMIPRRARRAPLISASLLLATVAGPALAQSAAPSAAPAAAGAGPARPGPLPPAAEAAARILRYHREDEDWRWLARGSRTPDPYDPIKFIPVAKDVSLSLGADVRSYYENYTNEGFGSGFRHDDWFQNRALVHADLRLPDGMRVFAQLQSAGVTDRKAGARVRIDRDDLDINQLFFEVPVPKGSLRLGRQELRLGVGRIVSTRDGILNVRMPVDGGRLILRGKAGRLDAFVYHQVLTQTGRFDDTSKNQPHLWGGQFAKAQSKPTSEGLEVYFLGYDNPRSTYFDGTGVEHRRTLGARAFGARNGFDHDVEANVQFGEFGTGEIRAWTFDAEAGYTFRKAFWAPRIGGQVVASSGDKTRGDGKLQSYRPFVARHPWGQLAAFGLTNVEGVQLVGNLQPTKTLRLTARNFWMRRQTGGEGLYTSGYFTYRPGGPAQSLDVGRQAEVLAEWEVNRHLRLTSSYSHLSAGRFITERGGKDIDYATFVALYRF